MNKKNNAVSLDLRAADDVGVKSLKHFFLEFKPRLLGMMRSHTDLVHRELRLLLRETRERPTSARLTKRGWSGQVGGAGVRLAQASPVDSCVDEEHPGGLAAQDQLPSLTHHVPFVFG